MSKKNIILQFDNERAAYHFALWLCEQGEQDYWMWMDERETEEEGPITATFKYHHNKKPFMEKKVKGVDGLLITAKSRRMDADD